MTPQRIADVGIIRQMRHLHAQATAALNTLAPVTLDIDNATLVAMWRSTQTCEIKTKRLTTVTYNN